MFWSKKGDERDEIKQLGGNYLPIIIVLWYI